MALIPVLSQAPQKAAVNCRYSLRCLLFALSEKTAVH